MKAAVKAALVTVMAFLLSGCFLVDLGMEVSSDDTVSGTMTVAIDEQFAGAIGELDSDGMIVNTDELPEGATVEPYEQDGFVGQTVTFEDVPLEELNKSMQQDGGTFSLVREGDTFVFTATVEMVDGAEGGSGNPDLEGMEDMLNQAMASGSMKMSVTFPGEVTDTNGDVDGTTVTWDLTDFLEESELYATASAEPTDEAPAGDEETNAAADTAEADDGDSGFPWLPVVLGVVAAIIVIGGAAYLITRRRKA